MFRAYDPKKDKKAIRRSWLEIGWIQDNKQQKKGLSKLLQSGTAWVAELNESAESLVVTLPGDMRYLNEEIPFTCIAAVTNSRVARKQRLATRLTAHALAQAAAAGSPLAILGMFEQGFYDRLGFGSGSYEYWVTFDPARLTLERPFRVPARLTQAHSQEIHQSRLKRLRKHGSCNLPSEIMTQFDMLTAEDGFGLGYFDGPAGELTHHMWLSPSDVESGPYDVYWMSYQTYAQFLELMALLKSLGDQVHLVGIEEPPDIQLQDFITQPFKSRRMSLRSKFEIGIRARAYWQARINDLNTCLTHSHYPGVDVRFNLDLHDPIQRYLLETAAWRGISGSYIVTLGESSYAEKGQQADLPTLTASVGAFTRLWLGVRPATALAVTDKLKGPSSLLAELDQALLLPIPHLDWPF